jgi:hypothetical protein
MKQLLLTIPFLVVVGVLASASTNPPPFAAQTVLLGSGTGTLFSAVSGQPSSACNKGDTAWDFTTPAVWQCTGGSTWISVSGTSGITGSGSGSELAVWSGSSSLTGVSGLTSDGSGDVAIPGTVTTNGGDTNSSSSLLRQQGDTWLDVATGAAVSLGSGLTSNWNPYGAGSAQTLLDINPNAPTTNGQISATDTVVDGIVSDGTGVAPISGGLHMLCQSSTNHGWVNFQVAESSASSTANQLYISAQTNAPGTLLAIGHRQCVMAWYNPDRSKWQFAAASDGVMKRFAIDGYYEDVALASSISNYAAGGSGATHLCGITNILWASAATTTVHNWATCNVGDIKEIEVYGAGITVNNEDTTGCSGCSVFDFNQLGTNKVLHTGCTYWFQETLNGWKLVNVGGESPGSC